VDLFAGLVNRVLDLLDIYFADDVEALIGCHGCALGLNSVSSANGKAFLLGMYTGAETVRAVFLRRKRPSFTFQSGSIRRNA
jgi:hypothetical protein